MPTDILIFNTAVLDLRSPDFAFADDLVGPGGLAKCPADDMPDVSQQQLKRWIDSGGASAGGPGNTAPLLAKAGLEVAVGAYLGKGDCDGLDIQGRTFHDILDNAGVDMSACEVHPTLPTGTTFIHDAPGNERGGIAYFPNANDDFDFEAFKPHVERLNPKVVYYMYSGLSTRGDADSGRDLAEFIDWCRDRGTITIVDSHTLTAEPQKLIQDGTPVDAYHLLEPLLPNLDIFFTSSDEAKMIQNTLDEPRNWAAYDEHRNLLQFLDFLLERCGAPASRARLFGVTVSNGAFAAYVTPGGETDGPRMIPSDFMAGKVIDLVGAGDSFRAGLIAYVARNAEAFHTGTMNLERAIQMGNLMASRYIQAPLGDRYRNIRRYEEMVKEVG